MPLHTEQHEPMCSHNWVFVRLHYFY